MSNDYYVPTGTPATGAFGASAPIRTEYAAIAAGFDKLPALSGLAAGTAVIVNTLGTGLTNTTGTLALAGNFATTGAFALTLIAGAAVSLTLPVVSGTLATLAGTETLSNKTLVAPALGTPVSGVLTNCTGTAAGLSVGFATTATSATTATTATLASTVTTNANLTGPITSVGNATSIASQTGTGSKFVVDNGPTLISPLLGTPASGVLTNCTGLPAAAVVAGALANGMTATTQANGDNSTKLTTTAYLYSAIGGTVVRSYLAGMGLSRSSATVLGIAAGVGTDSTNAAFIIVGSAFTKSTAGTWVVGSGSNGMGTGLTIANSTWYHVFAIINAGNHDYYFDTSVTAANKPASTTAFRRIGSFKTDSSAQILAFIQVGDKFQLAALITETAGSGAGPTLQSLVGVPPGVVTTGIFSISLSASGGTTSITVSTPNTPTTAGQLIQVNGTQGATVGFVDTNTSNQVNVTYTNIGFASASSLATMGWIDRRGQDE